jgi:hypothetical protein
MSPKPWRWYRCPRCMKALSQRDGVTVLHTCGAKGDRVQLEPVEEEEADK